MASTPVDAILSSALEEDGYFHIEDDEVHGRLVALTAFVDYLKLCNDLFLSDPVSH